MSTAQLLWRRANKATLDTLRGVSRGQYDIRLGRTPAPFFEGLPEVADHEGARIEIWTEPVPDPSGDGEATPWNLTIRRMADDSVRRDWYVKAQRPGSAHPLWRPGTGPTARTEPETDYALLLRTTDDRFFAGWLRGRRLPDLAGDLAQKLASRQVGVTALSEAEAESVLDTVLDLPAGTASNLVGDETPAGDEEVDLEPELPAVEPPSAHEGQPVKVQHFRRERSRTLRKARVAAAGERPLCEACGFDFEEVYGERGRGFIECHHLIPLSELDPAVPTRLEDLALLCANCHRMVHVARPWLAVDALKALIGTGK